MTGDHYYYVVYVIDNEFKSANVSLPKPISAIRDIDQFRKLLGKKAVIVNWSEMELGE